MDQQYATTKATSVGKHPQNLGYQGPMARKGQFRNKRQSDSNGQALKQAIEGSIGSKDAGLDPGRKLLLDELQKSATKPGAYS